MTKPQIWVASFLMLFIILFILGRLTNEDEVLRKSPPSGMFGQSEQVSTENLSGKDLVSAFGCTDCHGIDLKGTKKGPELKNISANFSRQQLINYLRNPSSFMNSDRFKKYRKQYPEMLMPGFGNKDVKDLGKIADFLLSR